MTVAQPWDQLYLPKSHAWFLQTMHGVPAQPEIGDREPVMNAIHDIVDAAGMLEYSRGQLQRNIAIAQQEWETLKVGLGIEQEETELWAGTSTRAVYYAFYTAVTASRTVTDRFEERLRGALAHDRDLWKQLQRMRSEEAGSVFEDARHLAGCYLHLFTPPYPNFSAEVVHGQIIYPVVDNIDTNEKKNYPAILKNNFRQGRHASAVMDDYWECISSFIDRLVQVFYPPKS